MKPNRLINTEIENFYTETSEEDRLMLGLGPLEFERNKDLIQRYLPSSKGTVIDVGGGPGIYAEWLAGFGHIVHLVDPVPKHIKQATKRADKLKKTYQSHLGEARKLDFQDGFADIVILHGPLYHLQQRDERIDAITEAKRVLKPNGIVLGFAINYTASTIVGLLNGLVHDDGIFKMCKEELTTGVHNPPKNIPGLLPSAYYHKPSELRNEFEETGLTYLETYAVEGSIWLDKNYFESRADPKKKDRVLELLKMTENNKDLLALSPHMMIAGRK